MKIVLHLIRDYLLNILVDFVRQIVSMIILTWHDRCLYKNNHP